MFYEYINILYMNFIVTKKQSLSPTCIVRKFCVHPYNLDCHRKLFKSYDSASFWILWEMKLYIDSNSESI